jgi:hypothetical protein
MFFTFLVSEQGNLIIRLSWRSQPVLWNNETRNKVTNACTAICMLLENCC